MRLGLNRKTMPPHRMTGYGLIALGALIMLFSLPTYIYLALIGGFLAYYGHSLRGR